jgi:hypothetical protein
MIHSDHVEAGEITEIYRFLSSKLKEWVSN